MRLVVFRWLNENIGDFRTANRNLGSNADRTPSMGVCRSVIGG